MTERPAPSTDGAPDVVVVALGQRIRAIRRARGLTLVQLAARSDLSHPFLSQVERGVARPSIGSLGRIARALGTSQVELMSPAPPVAQVTVLRAGEGRRGRYDVGTARVLTEPPCPFHLMEVAGANTEFGHAFGHAEHEWVYVLRGTVEIEIDDRVHTLGVGDSVLCPGGTVHRWRSADRLPFSLLIAKERLPL